MKDDRLKDPGWIESCGYGGWASLEVTKNSAVQVCIEVHACTRVRTSEFHGGCKGVGWYLLYKRQTCAAEVYRSVAFRAA